MVILSYIVRCAGVLEDKISEDFEAEKYCALFSRRQRWDAQGKSPLCDIKWMLDLAFLVDVASHLIGLNLNLQWKDKLIARLVNDIWAFKIMFKLFISQLENKDLSQFS